MGVTLIEGPHSHGMPRPTLGSPKSGGTPVGPFREEDQGL